MRPELWNVPMAVAGNPENRHGIILAKNNIAKKFGVVTAEAIWEAKRKCPDLVLVPPQYDKYQEFYEKINQIYLDYTDLVEPFSIDESFLDVTGTLHLFKKTPKELADEIRARVEEELGITVSIGVSFCKVFAKLGSDYKKPNATTVIFEEDVENIVYPLPIRSLFSVGKKSAEILNNRGIHTIGDLADMPEDFLEKILGKQGRTLYSYVHCLDDEPVRSFYDGNEAKSISKGMTFKHDLIHHDEIKAGVNLLSDAVVERLRADHKKAYTIQVTIKDASFKTIQRQRKLDFPTRLNRQISEVALELIENNWEVGKRPIRLIAINCTELVPEDMEIFTQQSLFEKIESVDNKKVEKIEDTMADIREKFGKDVIKFGYINPLNDKEK